MNSFLVNYIKRDVWLHSGVNWGTFLREKDKLIHKEKKTPRQAHKIVSRYLWRALRRAT